MKISQAAVELILESEGVDQPGKWPGGGSGITLGFGFDLGFYTAKQFEDAWGRYLKPEHVVALKTALGKTGGAARSIAGRFAGIKVTRTEALEVFNRVTLPTWTEKTAKAFPGSDSLPPDAFGGLVSLCFNRGTQIDSSDRRREMLAIRNLLAAWDGTAKKLPALLAAIAAEFRSMKRIWRGKGLDGLITRRENEAKLIERA